MQFITERDFATVDKSTIRKLVAVGVESPSLSARRVPFGRWRVVLEEIEETLAYSFDPFQVYFWTQHNFSFWLLKTFHWFLQQGGPFFLRFHTTKKKFPGE